MAGPEMTSSDLASARLPQRRSGPRFVTADVDDFLDRCSAALAAAERGLSVTVSSDEVVHQAFRTVALFGVGYDADAVDDLLDHVAVQLREYEPGAQLRAEQERQDEREVRGMLEKVQQELRERRGEA